MFLFVQEIQIPCVVAGDSGAPQRWHALPVLHVSGLVCFNVHSL